MTDIKKGIGIGLLIGAFAVPVISSIGITGILLNIIVIGVAAYLFFSK